MAPPNDDSKKSEEEQSSPQWNWTTKLIIGLALVALSIWLLVQFQNFLGPLISAFILAYLIHPVAGFLKNKTKIPWRLSVTIIYLLLVISVLGLVTWGGFTLVEQIQNLIRFIDNNLDQLPDLVADISSQSYQIGPFDFSPAGFNWDEITNEIVRAIQPLIGRVGGFASSIASGAASIVSWLALILLVSYFLLAESEGIPSRLLNINLPGYKEDLSRMGDELNRIWNAFIRGEILIVFFSLIIYTVMLGSLGIQFFFGLALIAAIGQLIPYLGAWITWISFGLVALFQTNIPYNLSPGIYMLIVLGVSMLINNIIDNILRTKVMSESLKVHPAMVLIGALIGVQVFGFIGIIIAAPVMASLKLLLDYIVKKLNDQYPWEDLEVMQPQKKNKWLSFIEQKWQRFTTWVAQTFSNIKHRINKADTDSDTSASDDID